MKFSKKLLLLACLMISPLAMAKRTKKLDLLIFPEDSSYLFEVNAGEGLSDDPAEIRPAGASVISSLLIFPGGTVSKHQTNFSVDRHDNAIDPDDSLGVAYLNATMLADLDPENLPESGTNVELVDMVFDFRKSCHGENLVVAQGVATMDVVPAEVGEAVMKIVAAVLGGTGCNQFEIGNGEYQIANQLTAKMYQAETGEVPALIQVKFKHHIEYND